MRGELLKIPRKPRVKFGTHFLSSVHCQLTLPPIPPALILENESLLAEALNFLNISETVQIHEGSWKFQVPNQPDQPPQLHNENHQAIGLRFIAGSPRTDLAVSGTSIIYSEYEYSGFENFSKNLIQIAECAKSVLKVQRVSCVGLRKINSMHVGPVSSIQDAVSAFNPALFGMVKSGVAETQAVKVFEGSLALQKDRYACLIKHRLRNLEEDNRFEVNLDFDLLDQNEREIDNNFSELLEDLNDTSFDVFSWAVGEELTGIMNSISSSE